MSTFFILFFILLLIFVLILFQYKNAVKYKSETNTLMNTDPFSRITIYKFNYDLMTFCEKLEVHSREDVLQFDFHKYDSIIYLYKNPFVLNKTKYALHYYITEKDFTLKLERTNVIVNSHDPSVYELNAFFIKKLDVELIPYETFLQMHPESKS